MRQGMGELVELVLEEGLAGGRVLCPEAMVPAPGQYLLAHEPESPELLPLPLFNAALIPGGFMAAPPVPGTWRPGTRLSLRGPLGRGFKLPPAARRVALAALGPSCARLMPVLQGALDQGAAVVLVGEPPRMELPHEVEVQPVAALSEVAAWAEYLAVDLPCDRIQDLPGLLGNGDHRGIAQEAQVLVAVVMPCGGLAECGACAVPARRGSKLACVDGPVFELSELL